MTDNFREFFREVLLTRIDLDMLWGAISPAFQERFKPALQISSGDTDWKIVVRQTKYKTSRKKQYFNRCSDLIDKRIKWMKFHYKNNDIKFIELLPVTTIKNKTNVSLEILNRNFNCN